MRQGDKHLRASRGHLDPVTPEMTIAGTLSTPADSGQGPPGSQALVLISH